MVFHHSTSNSRKEQSYILASRVLSAFKLLRKAKAATLKYSSSGLRQKKKYEEVHMKHSAHQMQTIHPKENAAWFQKKRTSFSNEHRVLQPRKCQDHFKDRLSQTYLQHVILSLPLPSKLECIKRCK